MQLPRLTDLVCPKRSAPAAPSVLFVFAPNEPLEVHSPDDILRLHEIQRGKRYGNGRSPSISPYPCFGSPDSIPAGITVLGVPHLFVGYESVSLRAQRIDLENIPIAPVPPGVDHDFKIVIQFLSYIPAQLRGDGTAYDGIVTRDYKIDFMLGIEDTDFRPLGRSPPLVGLSLQKVGNRCGLLPERIVKRAIHLRSPVNPACLRIAERPLNSWLRLRSMLTGLCLGDNGQRQSPQYGRQKNR